MPASSIDILRYTVAGLFCLVVSIAAISDIKTRRIPNWAVLSVVVLSIAWCAVGPAGSFAAAFASGGIALAVTALLYAFGFIGAGDSKLFAATALFVGLHLLPQFALVTSVAGGVLALAKIIANPQRALAIFHLRGNGGLGDGIPYGVAIAVAGAAVVAGTLFGL